MEAMYLPAIQPTTIKDGRTHRPIHWMDVRARGRDAYYPQALISYFHWRTTPVRFNPGTFLLGDSGGYSVASLGANIDPVSSLRWQIENVTTGPILDMPPHRVSGTGRPPLDDHAGDFEYCLGRTERNVQRALPTYNASREAGGRFRWMGVVHGLDSHELEEWYQRIADIYPFTDGDGWCMKAATKPRSLAVARCLRLAEEQGIRRLHFFQSGGIGALATMLALGPRVPLERLTVDSSSPITSGNNRGLLIPHGDGLGFQRQITEKFRATRGVDRRARTFMLERCGCPSCDWLREDLADHPDLIDNPDFDEEWKYRFGFHNVVATMKVFRTLAHEAKRDPERLLREILGSGLFERTVREFDGLAVAR